MSSPVMRLPESRVNSTIARPRNVSPYAGTTMNVSVTPVRKRRAENAVRWARQEGMPLRARSGGHSYEAYSVVDDGPLSGRARQPGGMRPVPSDLGVL